MCVDRVQMTAWDRGGGDSDKKTLPVSFSDAVPTMDAGSPYKGQSTLSETDFHIFHGLLK